jgi:transposase, IS30 family
MQQLAVEKRQEEKPKKIYFTDEIKAFVITWLNQDYSPEQIVGLATRKKIKCFSIQRIYQFIWQDKKDGGNHYTHPRTKGRRYRKRGQSKDKRGQIIGRVDIDQRPVIDEEKSRMGDLEMDLVIGKDHKGLGFPSIVNHQ